MASSTTSLRSVSRHHYQDNSVNRTRYSDYKNRNKSGFALGSFLLSVTFSLCIVLGLVCTCLAVFVIFLDQRVEAANLIDDSRRAHSYAAMPHEKAPSDLAFRLPTTVKPISYDLYLHPDLNEKTFEGRVTITLELLENRKYIVLHQKDLSIAGIELKTSDLRDNFKFDIAESYPVESLEMFVITPTEELLTGIYNLSLSFRGSLKSKITGFYASSYKDEHNNTRTIATTKFEPTYARSAFPCFDEPAFKAEFSVKLVHPTGDCYSAISNMNIKNSEPDKPSPGLTTVTFAKSVPMSTYVTCFIISDLVAVTKIANGLHGKVFPVSVYTTRAQKDKGVFPLDMGVKLIEYYIKLFQIDYPLPKLDMASIPDFVSGAMENWGLVTYREALFLYDSKISSTVNKKRIVEVVAHEFSHMWFGNLVTMAWWNDLWLNEGFATFMAAKSADALLPEWHFMDGFLTSSVHSALSVDAKLSSHPIIQTVTNPDEITAIFDTITYQKGASILRMLENFVGPEIFYPGVSKYLEKHAFQNAQTKDLLNILQGAIGDRFNIAAILNTWTRQKGFPVINVEKHKFTYTLTQKRFLENSESTFDPSESEYGYRWTIPVTYITSENAVPTMVWFDKDAEKLVVKLDEPVDWIKFNVDQIGYYRVNYNRSEWDTLLNVLEWSPKRFSSLDRTHLLEDAFSLAKAGELDYSVPLDMTLYLKKDKYSTPWKVATNKLESLDILLSSTPVSEKFREYVRQLVDSTYHDVTWNVDEMDSNEMLSLRSLVLDLACSVGHSECLEDVGNIFKAWVADPKDRRPHPDIRQLVYYYGMHKAGDEEIWNKVFEKFKNETNASEKNKLMAGLTAIRSAFVLKKLLSLAMDESVIRSQDALGCISTIAENPDGASLVWDWVRENWELLVKRYTLNDRYLGQLIPAITKGFASEVKLTEMKVFFEKYPEAGAGATSRSQALETVSNNIRWLAKNGDTISKWLDSRPVSNHPN